MLFTHRNYHTLDGKKDKSWRSWFNDKTFCSSHHFTKHDITIALGDYTPASDNEDRDLWVLHKHNVMREICQKFKARQYRYYTIEKDRMDDFFEYCTLSEEKFRAISNFLNSNEGHTIFTAWNLKIVKYDEYKEKLKEFNKPYRKVNFFRWILTILTITSLVFIFPIFGDSKNKAQPVLQQLGVEASYVYFVIFGIFLVLLGGLIAYERLIWKKVQPPCYVHWWIKGQKHLFIIDDNFRGAFFEVWSKDEIELKRIFTKYAEKGYHYDDEGSYVPDKE